MIVLNCKIDEECELGLFHVYYMLQMDHVNQEEHFDNDTETFECRMSILN